MKLKLCYTEMCNRGVEYLIDTETKIIRNKP